MQIRIWYALIGLAGAVILAAAPLPHVDSDAPLYSRIAANVLRSGDWVTFHHPGWLVDKPPVVFWLMAVSFKALGISDVSMRLWQLLLAIGLIVLTGRAARAAGLGREESVLAALVLATSLQFFYQATVPQQDVPLTFFLTVALLGVLEYVRRSTVWWSVLAAVAVALAVLTKGIVGLVLFGLMAAAAALVARPRVPCAGRDLAARLIPAAVGFVLVAVPWFVAGIVRQGDEFVNTFFTMGTLGIGRFFRPAISSPPPYWLSIFAYIPVLLLGFLPWSPVLVVAVADLPQWLRKEAIGVRVVAVWFLLIVALLSLSSGDKVFRYLLPSFPPAAILAGRAATELFGNSRRLRLAGGIALAPAALLAGAGFWHLWAQFPPERDLLISVVLPVVSAIVAGLMAFGGFALGGRGRTAAALAALGAMAGFALFERGMLAHAAEINPWPAMASSAAPLTPTADRLVLYGRAGEGFNFAHLYLDKPVVLVNAAGELSGLWERERVLVVVPKERFEDLARLSPAPVVIHVSPARLLLVTNRLPPGR